MTGTRSVLAVVTAVVAAAACSGSGDDEVRASGEAGATGPGVSGHPWEDVDAGRWPVDIAAAGDLLTALPPTLGTAERELRLPSPGGDSEIDVAGASYGDAALVTVADGERIGAGPAGTMAALFGIVYACAEGSYEGTAPGPGGPGGGPAVAESSPSGPVWFSCAVEGAEGDPEFTGHALGWTGERTAWLVVARDEADLATLVTALRPSAG